MRHQITFLYLFQNLLHQLHDENLFQNFVLLGAKL
ncbi:unnamed protein product [Schistosoma curassoni]|uniref:Uncharacterized protein n=1 Tax=Schistosoma curassoni TaxID=6186 RepID=A0A183JIR7_9TREM|nr:unnamed protein product [Schistosoma curassoni]